MIPPSLDRIRTIVHRLFIQAPGTSLRKEDEQKCRELTALVALLARVRRGAHVVDAAAGKASVGLVAAELLPIDRVTVLERDPRRVAACRAAADSMLREVTVDVREADVADPAAWPEEPDVVVALHACGAAADLVLDGAIRSRARQLLLVPCCYGENLPFRAGAAAAIERLGFLADDLLRRRVATAFIDMERKLRLEAAGYETTLGEFVAPTVTPHNLVFTARRTGSAVRVTRAKERLAALREMAGAPAPRET